MTVAPALYTILFDARCQLCQRSRLMILRSRPTARVRFVDINDARQVAEFPQMAGADTRGQMHVIDPAGRVSGGYDALVALAPILPPFAWMAGLLRLPLARALGRRAYAWLAANRYRLGGQVSCHDGACQLKPATGFTP